MPILVRCHKGIGPAATGTALVAADNFSARYDLDRTKGIFSRPSHKLAGQRYAGRILVLSPAASIDRARQLWSGFNGNASDALTSILVSCRKEDVIVGALLPGFTVT